MPETPNASSFWKRLLIGAAMVVAASGMATAAAAFNELDKIVDALREGGQLEFGDELAEAGTGDPQTVMLVGSDDPTPGTGNGSGRAERRSDTIILARLDPAKGATALMSLPRDLKVDIPGVGTDKLNAAYEQGGPKLTLQTVKRLTGLRINHVINIDFNGFRRAVDELGCVYADVDRRYYYTGGEFSAIDLQPGYQRLCGPAALSYVRFRHEDNDLVRSARQQDFLRQVKQQVGVNRLISDRDDLIDVFGRFTDSDVDSRADTLSLLKLALASADQPIREVHFEGRIGETYVEASSARVQQLTQEFLGVKDTKGPRAPSETGESAPPEASDGSAERAEKGTELDDASAEGAAQAEQAEALGAKLPVFYPRVRTPGSQFLGDPYVYEIPVDGQRKQPAYRMVLATGSIGEYYGIQGTTWRDPPILNDPQETRTISGRKFELQYDGDRLRLVAWRTKQGSYWISNTLTQSLSAKEMLAIAKSTREL